ncbi:arginine:ornithine antiporter/lysine permease [Scopulibacillus daqui]|uniref:Arginine:ornithine antiporter/lysine permease n=1 Tax=Scopulibacillus daqui TaxID=1469162 RepID=A0ABS2Q120_9BACL|nr:amino acid permease [Scopulibacillus daqui]MBM7645555.1 arginine:ornithine antiporter/lysine permease [Scopulibacillus daqui]
MANHKLNVWVLTALVVGNMVGSGIFMLPRSLAEAASPGGVLFAWLLTGLGVLFIAFVYGILSVRKPDVIGGPQIYAKKLFPEGSQASRLCGYLVSWGYWVANVAGIIAVITTFTGYLSTFFPIMNSAYPLFQIGGMTVTAGHFLNFLVCSIMLWGIYFLVLKGVEEAGKVNFAATAAKVLGFILFIIVTLFAFQSSNMIPFIADKAGRNGESVGLFAQVHQAALTTLWAFIGVESAVVFSSRAKSSQDIKKATVFGLLIALAIYIGITMLVMGTLSQDQLIHSSKPLVDALSAVIGDAGGYVLAALALISLLGSTIGWVLLTAEVPYQSAKQGLFLKSFMKENESKTPVTSLIITVMMCQLFIFSTISQSISGAFDFVVYVATLAYLIPYIIASLYLLKIVIKGENYQLSRKKRWIDGIIGFIAAAYSLWIIKAGTADLKTFLFGMGLIVLGIVFYPLVLKNHSAKSKVHRA